MNTCTVCGHGEREAIEQALRAKLPLRQVAVRFSISKDAARRHLRHVAPIPDPLLVPIPQCPAHGRAPFRFVSGAWTCSYCDVSWDGTLAYFRTPDET